MRTKMTFIKKIIICSLAFLPMMALAYPTYTSGFVDPNIASNPNGPLATFMDNIYGIIDWLGPLLITVATIYFVWGVTKYVAGRADEKRLMEARQTMIYGVIGLFVIVSVWGLVAMVQHFAGIDITVGPPEVHFHW